MNDKKYTHLLILGDFNINETDWNSGTTAVGETHTANMFLECVRDFYLYQHVREVSRHRSDTKPSHSLDFSLSFS